MDTQLKSIKDCKVTKCAKTVIRGRHILKYALVNMIRNMLTDGCFAHPTDLLAALLKKHTNKCEEHGYNDVITSRWQSCTI